MTRDRGDSTTSSDSNSTDSAAVSVSLDGEEEDEAEALEPVKLQTSSGPMDAALQEVILQRVFKELEEVLGKLAPEHMQGHLIDTTTIGEEEGGNAELQAAEQSLSALPSLSSCYVGGMVYEWSPRTHPYIGGGYASAVAGCDVLYGNVLSTPLTGMERATACNTSGSAAPCNKIFFAGEAYSAGAGATATAAMKTGAEAAVKVMQSLHWKDVHPGSINNNKMMVNAEDGAVGLYKEKVLVNE